jgi:3-hydroxybutyryl-CoA dehydratase
MSQKSTSMSDEILTPLPAIGQTASQVFVVDDAAVRAFANLSYDHNPIHLDDAYATLTSFGRRIAHGMLSAAYISSVLGNELPGPGAIYLGQTLRFVAPVYIGDTLTVTVEVVAAHVEKRIITLRTVCRKQDGVEVVTGEAMVKV